MTEALQLEIRTLKELLDSERDPAGRAFAPLAEAYRKAGRVPEALRILRDGIAKHPDFVTGHVVAAQLYVEQGLAAEGAIAARRALELDGENVNALKSLLRALDETGAGEEAERVRSLLTTLEPDFEPDWVPSGPVVVERALEPEEPALSPTMALGSLQLEPAIEEPAAPDPEDETPSVMVGMIDLSSIGPIPSAELPVSALAPDLPSSAEPPVALSGLDFGLSDLTMAVDEQPSGAVTEPMIELAPESDDEPVMDLALLAPSAEDEPVMDLALLAPSADDEPVMDLALLAPSADDEPVMDLALLAPSADDEPVMDLALLAPSVDVAADDVGDPSPSAADTVVDVIALAPTSSVIEEPVFDLAALAPSNLEAHASSEAGPSATEAPPPGDANVPAAMVLDEEPVFELETLAPAETDLVATQGTGSAGSAAGSGNGLMADDEASQIGFVSSLSAHIAPDEVVIDLDGLRVEPTVASAGPLPTGALEVEISAAATPTDVPPSDDAADDAADLAEPSSPTDTDTPSDDQGEPIFTRTLAELYAAQGAVKEAVSVLRRLLADSPGNEALTRRIAQLESGAPVVRAPRDEVPAALPGQDDDEVEALARELAESGRGSQDTESPFTWTDRESAPPSPSGPTIREYFDGLLKWEPRDS